MSRDKLAVHECIINSLKDLKECEGMKPSKIKLDSLIKWNFRDYDIKVKIKPFKKVIVVKINNFTTSLDLKAKTIKAKISFRF